jgi:hypothetical protein
VQGRYYWKGWRKDVDRYISRAENPRDKTPALPTFHRLRVSASWSTRDYRLRPGRAVHIFWNEFCGILRTKLKLSTAYHAPTDGQTEIINKHIIMRLRPLINYYQDNWSQFCPMIDHAAGALMQESVGLSPFFINHGREPRLSFD